MKPLIIITGPTAVGKSDIALAVASRCNGEIINADVGQSYAPLSIGTAKPNWRTEPIVHHLFDTIERPINANVMEYRRQVKTLAHEIVARGATPIIVGGSGFYIMGLLFAPQEGTYGPAQEYSADTATLWQQLNTVDPTRAAALAPSDRYRIVRALEIFDTRGVLPSHCAPRFEPVHVPVQIINITREAAELHARISQRVQAMIQQGWIDEVRALDNAWQSFLMTKKLIGYDDIVRFLQTGGEIDELTAVIARKTRQYAKRQATFARMLRKKCQKYDNQLAWHEELVSGSAYDAVVQRIIEVCKKG